MGGTRQVVGPSGVVLVCYPSPRGKTRPPGTVEELQCPVTSGESRWAWALAAAPGLTWGPARHQQAVRPWGSRPLLCLSWMTGCQGVPKSISSTAEPQPAGAAPRRPFWQPQRPLSSCAPTPGPASVPQASCGRSGPPCPCSEEGSPEGPGQGAERARPCSWRLASLTAPGLSPGSCLTTGLRGCPACTGVRSWRRCESRAGLRAGLAGTLTFRPGWGLGGGRGSRTGGDGPTTGAQACLRQLLGAQAARTVAVIRAGQGAAVGLQGPWALVFHRRTHTRARTHVHTRVQEGTWAAGTARTEPRDRLRAPVSPAQGLQTACLRPGARQGASCCPEAQGPPPTQTPVCWALLVAGP